MQRMTIRVTQEMIDAAIERDKGNCAIAIAIRYVDSDLGWVKVSRDSIRVSDRNSRLLHRWIAPPPVRRFIDAFDADKSEAKPFAFTLDPDNAVETKPMNTVPPLQRRQRPSEPKPPKPAVEREPRQTSLRTSVAWWKHDDTQEKINQ